MLSLSQLEFFEGLGSHHMEQLSDAAVVLTLDKGEVVYLPGEQSDHLYIVAEGRIKVSKLSETGKELTLAYHEPGEIFGEHTLLDGQPRRTMAVALLRSRIWAVPRENCLALARASSAFALRIGTIIGRRRHELENRMEKLVFRDVPARLAFQILWLADKYGVEKDGSLEIELQLSQMELANMIGATRETTSTALNELKREGILQTSHRKIIIKDLQRLKELEEFL
ncbi:MAG TPA: Crp/Fnr family transcriptional regulator [Acidobacteriota bacterium]|nr:Crp/Fnr family transcriptional regulator [Acidobacteriota bacterium]